MPSAIKKAKAFKKKRWAWWKSIGPDVWKRYSKGIYVMEGSMYAKELAFTGMIRPIPPEECAITSLFKANDSCIYGATSGKHAHVFRYQPKASDGAVLDIGIIENETAIKKSIVATEDNLMIGGTSSFGNKEKKYAGGKLSILNQ